MKAKRRSLVLKSSEWESAPQLRGGDKIESWIWDTNNPIIGRLRSHVYDGAVGAAVLLQSKRAELEKTQRFTEAGIRTELVRFTDEVIKPRMAKARQEVLAIRSELAERRSRISARPLGQDRNDPAAELRKIEARTVMRSMPHRELVRILAGDNPDPFYVEAALEAPARASGISESLRQEIERQLVRIQFGDELDELDELDSALETVTQTAAAADGAIQRELKGAHQAEPTLDAKRTERKDRVAFVEEHGSEAYFERAKFA